MATGTYSPDPFGQYFDNNGDPLASGKLETYIAGTSTPTTTWSDVGLTTPNANPIILDSAGCPTSGGIFLSPGVSYKFILKNSAGATIRTRDFVLAVPGVSNPTTDLNTVNLRLTLTSGTPVTITDVTAATTIYVEPYRGNRISLYDGATWNLRTVVATSFAVPATTSQMYDVFAYDNNSVVTYETLAWTNDTTRATALILQDGVLVKTGATTRRWIGWFRTTTVSGQTEDSFTKQFLGNYYNPKPRAMRKVEATDSWAYSTGAWRQANGAAANQIEITNGYQEIPIDIWVTGLSTSSGTAGRAVSIGENVTNANASGVLGPQAGMASGNLPAGQFAAHFAQLHTIPRLGYSFYAWIELGGAGVTFYGDNGDANQYQSGLNAMWWH